LNGNTAHPTAETLYEVAAEQMPGISLRTVYQTLSELSAMGEVQHIDLGSGAVRFDPNVDDHHHVVCSTCGVVHDVYVNQTPLQFEGDVEGFAVHSTRIVFSGECAQCAHLSAIREIPITTTKRRRHGRIERNQDTRKPERSFCW